MQISFLDTDFTALNSFLDEAKYTQLFILVDENTHEYCLPLFLSNLKTNTPFEIIEIEAGEEMKNITTATMIWEILADFKADRNALLMNLGGGMITDLGGFIASTYKRGIDFIHIPTSLLAMCDASIGGKTGVDLGHLKNMVGTFTLPQHIFVYPSFLKTLPYTELRSGFSEMLKHGLIQDYSHYKNLVALDELNAESISPFINISMMIKNKIVEQDFKEQNIRKILNFGHTFGHAIESLFLKKGQPIPHGEAVAIGMMMETHLSFLEHLISESDFKMIVNDIQKYYLPHSIKDFSEKEIFKHLLNDKKNNANKINFTLINKIGSATYNQTPIIEHIKQSIHFYKAFTK